MFATDITINELSKIPMPSVDPIELKYFKQWITAPNRMYALNFSYVSGQNIIKQVYSGFFLNNSARNYAEQWHSQKEAYIAAGLAKEQQVQEEAPVAATSSVTLPLMEFIKAAYPDFYYNWGNLDASHLVWLNQKYQAYVKAEPRRIEAQALMANAGDEALEMNLTITALLMARDRYNEAAAGLMNTDAKALANKLASVCQEFASAVKKVGR